MDSYLKTLIDISNQSIKENTPEKNNKSNTIINKNLVIKFPTNLISGYKKVLEIFLKGLLSKQFNLNFIPYTFNDEYISKYIHLLNKVDSTLIELTDELVICPLATEVSKLKYLLTSKERSKKFIYTMWESTCLDREIVNKLNYHNNIIIVPSLWNYNNFKNNDLKIPIHIVPLGIDPKIFFYYSPHKNNKFIFGCGIGQNQFRKNIRMVVECFCRAFPPNIKDVELRIKIPFEEKDRFPFFVDDRIVIYFDKFSDVEMSKFYSELDIFVSLSNAEGWGFMAHESMLCGRPVLAAPYGGISEFFTSENGIPVNFTEEYSSGIYKGGKWAKINENDVVDKMKFCYNNKLYISNLGKLAHEKVKHLTEENTISKFIELLEV